MQNLEKLIELATAITGPQKDAALGLVERMGEVIEGIGDKPQEFRPGILKLVQGTSDRGKLPKGATIGSFVIGEELLDQPVEVIVIQTWNSRQMWDPNPDNAKMLCNSPDGTVGFQYGDCKVCPNSKFDEEANRSACNKSISALVITRSLDKLFTVNFTKTNYMNGVDWQGLMRKAGVAPYKRVYKLTSQTSTKNKNVELIKAEPVTGEKVEDAVLAFVKELFDRSNTDRKEMLVKFHEYVKTKKSNTPALESSQGDVVLLAGAEDHDAPVHTISTDTADEGGDTAVVKKAKYKV